MQANMGNYLKNEELFNAWFGRKQSLHCIWAPIVNKKVSDMANLWQREVKRVEGTH